MSANIKFTEAEKRSFRVLPETCPEIEEAFSKAQAGVGVDVPEILAKYGIEASRKLLDAIHEISQRGRFVVISHLRDVVLHEGTFPLRLALVRKIEEEMRAAGEHVEDRSNYAYWISDWEKQKAFRASRQGEKA